MEDVSMGGHVLQEVIHMGGHVLLEDMSYLYIYLLYGIYNFKI